MTLTQQRAWSGVGGSATLTAIDTVGSGLIGDNSAKQSTFPTADILYSLTITANLESDVATLDLASGAVVQTTGVPEVARKTGGTADLAALDLEGVALPTAVRIYAIEITRTTEIGAVAMAASNTSVPDVTDLLNSNKGVFSLIYNVGLLTPGTLAFTFADPAESLTITILGKSS